MILRSETMLQGIVIEFILGLLQTYPGDAHAESMTRNAYGMNHNIHLALIQLVSRTWQIKPSSQV